KHFPGELIILGGPYDFMRLIKLVRATRDRADAIKPPVLKSPIPYTETTVIDRRQFAAVAAAAGTASAMHAGNASGDDASHKGDRKPFKLKYAPHFGMFEHSAGKD